MHFCVSDIIRYGLCLFSSLRSSKRPLVSPLFQVDSYLCHAIHVCLSSDRNHNPAVLLQYHAGNMFTLLFPNCFCIARASPVCHWQTTGSLDSSVGAATGYGLDGRGSIPGRVKRSFSFLQRPHRLWPTQPPIEWLPGAVSPGVKLPGG
jgi:hypothetical protein